MTSVALKGLAGRKLRAFLTALAIVLGVAMVSGTYVLTDTIKSAFDQIFAGSYENTAAVVTGKSTVSFAQSGAPTVPASVLAKVRALPDVQSATGQIFNLNDSSDYGKLIGRDGKPLGSSGNPTFAFGFDPAAGKLNPMSLTDGRWASGPHQIVIDSSSAKQGDFAVGDTIGASVEGPIKQYRIVGIAKFGSVDSLGGATIAIFDTRTAQGLLGKPGYDLIAVSANPGVPPEKLVGDIRPLLPSSAQVKTGAEQAKASAKDISEFTNFIQYFLLAFGIVALFVGAFVIFNTLSITVAQRTRELATLRTLGATRRQVRRSVLVEGFVIGVLASALGLALGVALAKGLSALMAAMSLDLPKAGTVFEARTVIVSMLLGTIVTLVASIAPAMKATRVPPIAAVREGATLPKGRFSSYRTAVSLSVVALSLALLGYGLFADGIAAGPRLLSLGVGVLALFVGVGLAASKAARPLASVLGRPFARFGVPGGLARQNAMRNPQRTAATAAALMIGLALVTMVATLGKGLVASDRDSLRHQVQADYVVTSKNGWDAFSRAAGDAAAAAPGVTVASSVRNEQAKVDGDEVRVDGIDPATIAAVLHVRLGPRLERDAGDARPRRRDRPAEVGEEPRCFGRRPDHGSQPGRPTLVVRRPGDLHPAEVRPDRPGVRFDRDLTAGLRLGLRAAAERLHVLERARRGDTAEDERAEAGAGPVSGREGRDPARLGRGAGEWHRSAAQPALRPARAVASWSACSGW